MQMEGLYKIYSQNESKAYESFQNDWKFLYILLSPNDNCTFQWVFISPRQE